MDGRKSAVGFASIEQRVVRKVRAAEKLLAAPVAGPGLGGESRPGAEMTASSPPRATARDPKGRTSLWARFDSMPVWKQAGSVVAVCVVSVLFLIAIVLLGLPPSARRPAVAAAPHVPGPIRTVAPRAPAITPQPAAAPTVHALVNRPTGRERVYSIEQVRYCLYESEILDALRGITTGDAEIELFNAEVEGYNAVCASYQYRVRDLPVVKAEVTSGGRRWQWLARQRLERWRSSVR